MLGWLAELGLDAGKIHAHALGLQDIFLEGVTDLDLGQLVVPEARKRGNFLTFRTPAAGEIYEKLLARNVITDRRADRLRFGFGLYQDQDDVARLCEVLGRVLD